MPSGPPRAFPGSYAKDAASDGLARSAAAPADADQGARSGRRRPRGAARSEQVGRVTVELELVTGDITAETVDAIVNAANSSLLGGGGVDDAIHRRGGPAILAECRALRASRYGRGLPEGQAVATTAGNLAAQWVIHTVGPVWSEREDRSALLRDCYTNSLRVAAELASGTVAFPLISSGAFGWPVDDAVRQAVAAIRAVERSSVEMVRLVLFDDFTRAVAERVAAGD